MVYWIRVYKTWANLRGKEENIEKLSPTDLDVLFYNHFMLKLKKTRRRRL